MIPRSMVIRRSCLPTSFLLFHTLTEPITSTHPSPLPTPSPSFFSKSLHSYIYINICITLHSQLFLILTLSTAIFHYPLFRLSKVAFLFLHKCQTSAPIEAWKILQTDQKTTDATDRPGHREVTLLIVLIC